LHGWRLEESVPRDRPAVESFRRLTRDLYIASGELGFWQGVIRDPTDPDFEPARVSIETRDRIVLSVLYGDHQGGQRMISLFSLQPRQVDDGWLATVGRHWNVDRPDPR
jgi:hypothetical protein